mmetsp:Transcript_25832/g.62730  ORF Transcript_25832/g.62730 Transcript_25832/m.62730 type:complete len:338 (-) Transcript_25832:659-1672(-)
MTSERISAILAILRNLAVLPVIRYRNDSLSKSLVRWYAISTTWWWPWRSASTPRRCQHSALSSFCAASSAASMLPHSSARLKRVRSSRTKCSATSGKPLRCRYAMIAWPIRFDSRTMRSTTSYLRRMSASLNTYSVLSIEITRFLPSRSRQYTRVPRTPVRYTGVSSVRMMPASPFGRQYLRWLSVVYTNTPVSSHTPDLMRSVSCTAHSCSSLRVAMITVSLLSSATSGTLSCDHTANLTSGVPSSASARRCCMSYSVTRSSPRSSSVPIGPANRRSVACGGAHRFTSSFFMFLITISPPLSTAKRLRPTNTADAPRPRFDSTSPPALSRGIWNSS